MNVLLMLVNLLGFSCFLCGMALMIFLPLALIFEMRRTKQPVFNRVVPFVSVIVPAYNEGKVIANCLNSILDSDYPCFEVIVVNDGSTDDTLIAIYKVQKKRARVGRRLVRKGKHPSEPPLTVLNIRNSGKATALNTGLRAARGEIVFLVDADGIFGRDTIHRMLGGFTAKEIGAVCGNDAPINLDRLLPRLINIQTHVSTGLVRRALALINCLPIVSGNIGAFRKAALDRAGLLRDGFIGEDLELTWRIHRAGFKVNFVPGALVYAESPSTVKDLWKQRVRWARGYLQTVRLHRDLFFSLKGGGFGLYLHLNFFSIVMVPVLQLLALAIIPVLVLGENGHLMFQTATITSLLGLGSSLINSLFAICLDRAWHDLKYVYIIPLWIPYSLILDCIFLWAIILELRKTSAVWNKLERRGIINRR
jgi:poly-beta-1,6-N-acetyl-D-glucosamine synthase